MTGVIINNNFYDISTGSTKIEYNSMGNGTLSYSMYGNEIPVAIEKIRQFIINGSTSWILDTDDTLWGCGDNYYGQQSNGESGSNKMVTTFTQRLTDVKNIFAAKDKIWALKTDGTLWGCGSGGDGQQGSGDTNNVTTFTQRMSDVAYVALGMDNSCYTTAVLKTDGTLWMCGGNYWGQQGSGDRKNVTTFTQRLTNVKKIFVYQSSTWAIKNDGTLWGCGSNYSGQQGISTTVEHVTTFTQRMSDVEDVFANAYSTWALKTDGTLWGCGGNEYGQQGSGDTNNVTTFTQRMSDVKNIFFNRYYTQVLKKDGTLWICGRNNYGQQGSGDTNNVTTFTQRMSDVKKIMTDVLQNSIDSNNTTIVLKNDNTLWGCGDTSYGIISANNNTIFTQLASEVRDFNCTYNSLWVLKNDNTLWGCGQRAYGQQGDGYTYGTDSYITTLTQRLTDVSRFFIGIGVWAIKINGDIYRTGWNDYGQKGEGNTTTIGTFTKLSFRES